MQDAEEVDWLDPGRWGDEPDLPHADHAQEPAHRGAREEEVGRPLVVTLRRAVAPELHQSRHRTGRACRRR